MSKRIATYLAVVLFAVAVARFVRVASVCESGWSYVRNEWQAAALGLVGRQRTPVDRLAPPKQADFWLAEVDRVLSESPPSAPVAMGAAWILDSSGNRYLQDRFRQSELASVLPALGMELDQETIEAEKRAFRQRCIERCLELAEQATAIDPDDVRWWRMRALLLFEGDQFYSGADFDPRTDDWLPILGECKSHDPENALYDYLAAFQLWRLSADYDMPEEPVEPTQGDEDFALEEDEFEDDPAPATDEVGSDLEEDLRWILNVRDPVRFAMGVDRFSQAQRLPFVAIGEAGFPAIPRLLALSSVGKFDQAEVALSRLVTLRHSTLYMRLCRWQFVRADDANRAADPERELRCVLQALRLCDQFRAAEETSALSVLTSFKSLRTLAYDRTVELAKSDPGLLEASRLAGLRQEEEAFRVEASSLQDALQTLEEERGSNRRWWAPVSSVGSTAVAVSLATAVLLALVGRRLAGRCELESLGLTRHVVVWVAVCGATLVVLGMAPAEMISHETQQSAAKIAVWAVALGAAAGVLWGVFRTLRRRRFRFRLITLLIAMTGVALVATVWPLVAFALSRIARSSPELWLPARGWEGFDPEVLLAGADFGKGSWQWTSLQWFAYGGPYAAILLSLLVVTVWCGWRTARAQGESPLRYWTRDARGKAGRLFAFAGRAALGAAACWAFLYLCVAPFAVRQAEVQYQYRMRYCRDPHAHWQEIKTAQAAVLETPSEIEAIRAQVHFELYGEGVLEQDFSSE